MAQGQGGQVQLVKDEFSQTLKVLALRVPCKKASGIRTTLGKSKLLLNRQRIKPIVSIPASQDDRLVLLDEKLGAGAEHLSPSQINIPEVLSELIKDEGFGLEWYTTILDYDHWSADYILKRLLPDVSEIPSSFETIGHIAHLNLRDELLPYKEVIGQVILDKNPRIKTVVNKIGIIENEFRVLPMEIIAGEDSMETQVIQHGVRFHLNFADVYWNSRLEHEHSRLIKTFKAEDVICDMTAGIGPFSIPAALKGCQVYANDLNPKCIHYLKYNATKNRVSDKIKTFCMDARQFVRTLLSEECAVFDHALINLPATGLEFVDVFKGVFSNSEQWQERELPYVHCYTFVHNSHEDDHVVKEVEKMLGCTLKNPSTREVRNVAPNKRMILISFQVPREAGFHLPDPDNKRPKLSN